MDANQRYYLLRRLHSLSGVIPVGVFLVQHIYSNLLAAWGPHAYQKHVDWLLDQPLLPLMSWGIVYLPLAFHSLLGFWYTFNSKNNVSVYKTQKNFMYMLQRLTGVIVFFYVIFHVATTSFTFDAWEKRNLYATMQNYFGEIYPWAFWLYCIGNIAAAFHFCNGFWGFCIMWGITVTKSSQKLMFKAMMGLFVVLAIAGCIGAASLAGKLNLTPDDQVKKEKMEIEQSASKRGLTPAKPGEAK